MVLEIYCGEGLNPVLISGLVIMCDAACRLLMLLWGFAVVRLSCRRDVIIGARRRSYITDCSEVGSS